MNGTRPCSVTDCARDAFARGWCKRHYARWSRHGDPESGTRFRRPSGDAAAILAHIMSWTTKTDSCWLWEGYLNPGGYGQAKTDAGVSLVHRWIFEQSVGPIPSELVLDHLCRVRRCINPAHLEPVTMMQNLERGASFDVRNGIRTSCVHGHEYTPENTVMRKSGTITCRECKRLTDQAQYRARTQPQAT